MALVSFTSSLARHVDCPSDTAQGATVREVLEAYFATHAGVRHYVLDDQGSVRKHVTVFLVGGDQHPPTASVDRSRGRRRRDPRDASTLRGMT